MRYTRVIAAAAAVTLMGTVSGTAQQKIYAYNSSSNFCPAGLQPVTTNGEICCGRPNQSMSYQQVMAQPATKKKKRARYVARKAECPVGTKGCTFD